MYVKDEDIDYMTMVMTKFSSLVEEKYNLSIEQKWRLYTKVDKLLLDTVTEIKREEAETEFHVNSGVVAW